MTAFDNDSRKLKYLLHFLCGNIEENYNTYMHEFYLWVLKCGISTSDAHDSIFMTNLDDIRKAKEIYASHSFEILSISDAYNLCSQVNITLLLWLLKSNVYELPLAYSYEHNHTFKRLYALDDVKNNKHLYKELIQSLPSFDYDRSETQYYVLSNYIYALLTYNNKEYNDILHTLMYKACYVELKDMFDNTYNMFIQWILHIEFYNRKIYFDNFLNWVSLTRSICEYMNFDDNYEITKAYAHTYISDVKGENDMFNIDDIYKYCIQRYSFNDTISIIIHIYLYIHTHI